MDFLAHFESRLSQRFSGLNGDFWRRYNPLYERQVDGINGKRFNGFLQSLPEAENCTIDGAGPVITINGDLKENVTPDAIKRALMGLSPWRKGPFNFFGTIIDAEWRSDLKWDRFSRLAPSLFTNKRVLDLGCHCGYYMCRALPFEPSYILGADPMPLPFYQFLTYYHYAKPENMDYLLLGIDDMTPLKHEFDTVLCMGVLYHRRDPDAAIAQMKDLLTTGGKLLLETLVIPGDSDDVLVPKGRYSAMPNVRQLPTVSRLMRQISKQGFSADLVHCAPTSVNEQRPTEWSTPTSLAQFLDPDDSTMTREGYPAPIRVIVICERQ